MKELNEFKIRELTPLDREYPERLRQIAKPPSTIYLRGTMPPDSVPSVGIIGARDCTEYGRETAASFARILGRRGISIISGMAYGIDSAGQEACTEAGGRTYAVFGNGLDICYPASHFGLYQKILQSGGGVLSQFPMGTPPLRANFAERNEVIAALSDVILVVEAKERSGTFITVGHALDQGKEIFAIPGPINARLSKGCNHLIREGAEIATSPSDILEYFGLLPDDPESCHEEDLKDLTIKQRKVLSFLPPESIHIDLLCEKTGIPVAELLAILLQLELTGRCECTKTGYYRKKDLK